MIYLKNTTAPQEVWIPRQDTNIEAVPKDCYTEGYDDGYNSGYEDGMKEGIPLQEKSVTIVEDVTEVLPDAGYSAMTKVTADATEYAQGRYDAGYADGKAEFKLQSKVYEVTGDTGNVTPDDDYDGLSSVEVDAVMYGKSKYNEGNAEGYASGYTEGQASVRLQEKSVSSSTATVEVTPDEGYSGMTKVSVDSSQYGQAQYQSGYTEGQESVRIQSKSVEITGDTQTITPDSGFDAMSSVTANAGTYGEARYNEGHTEGYAEGQASVTLQTKSVEVVANGEQTVSPDSGYSGMSAVTLNVNVPTGSTINNQDKTVELDLTGATAATAVTFDEDYTGLGTVTVNADATEYGNARYEEGQASVTLQEKSVTSATATVQVIPDEGYSGMSKVTVDSSHYGGLRFNEGYAFAMSDLKELDIFQNGTYTSSDYQTPYLAFGENNETYFLVINLINRDDYYRVCFRTHQNSQGPLLGSPTDENGVKIEIDSEGTLQIGLFGVGAAIPNVTTDEWHILDICAKSNILILDDITYPFNGEPSFPGMYNLLVGGHGPTFSYCLKNTDIRYVIKANYDAFELGTYQALLVPYDDNGTAALKNLVSDGVEVQSQPSSAITYNLLAPDPGWSTVVANVYPKLQQKSYVAQRAMQVTITPDKGYQGLSQVDIYNQDQLYDSGVTEGKQNILESLKSKEISSNGQYNASDEGENGWSSVTVNVVNTAVTLQSKTVDITQNGQTNVTPDTGYDGLSQVTVNVDVTEMKNQDKEVTITANTETVITPDEGYNGLGKVTVHTQVPEATIVTMTQEEYDALPSPDENTIYLITGTEEGGN